MAKAQSTTGKSAPQSTTGKVPPSKTPSETTAPTAEQANLEAALRTMAAAKQDAEAEKLAALEQAEEIKKKLVEAEEDAAKARAEASDAKAAKDAAGEDADEDRRRLAEFDARWTQPEISIGRQIVFYSSGTKDSSPQPQVVRKLSQSGRAVVCQSVWGGEVNTGVRHVDDPRLKLDPMQRKNGAWDFTDDHFEMITLREAVEKLTARVDELEGKTNS